MVVPQITDDEKLRLASEADRLLREPLLVMAFEEMEQSALAELLQVKGADPEDDRMRRALIDRINIIRSIPDGLRRWIESGKRAAKQPQRYA